MTKCQQPQLLSTMDIEPEEQIPSTVQFTTYAEPLPSTMEINTDSTSDQTTDSDGSTSFMDVSSANTIYNASG